jgi:alginate lyase
MRWGAVMACAAGMLAPATMIAVVSPAPGRAVPLVRAAAAPGPHERGIWLPVSRLRKLPTSGAAWVSLKAAADGDLGQADIDSLDGNHDVRTLAVALVYARTGEDPYRRKVSDALVAAMDADRAAPDSTYASLAHSRNIVSYVIAADLVDLATFAPDVDARFRTWLGDLPMRQYMDQSMVHNHETDANNHGTMAGAGRAAIAAYLGDTDSLARIATVLRGWLGDRSVFSGFAFQNDLSWQADAGNPVGINPPNATKEGHALGGALPEEMRRGCPLRAVPCVTHYPWEGLAGAIMQAQLLAMQGYDPWGWSDGAFRRAVQFMYDLADQDAAWRLEPQDDDSWVVHTVNYWYGTHYPTTGPAAPSKIMGWTSWTLETEPRTAPADEGAAPGAPEPGPQVAPPAAMPPPPPAPLPPAPPPSTPAVLPAVSAQQTASAHGQAIVAAPPTGDLASISSRHRITVREARRRGVAVGVAVTPWTDSHPRIARVRLRHVRGGHAHVLVIIYRVVRSPLAFRLILKPADHAALLPGRYEIDAAMGLDRASLGSKISRRLTVS